MFRAEDYLDLSHTNHAHLFKSGEQAWTALTRIEAYLDFRLQAVERAQNVSWAYIGENVFIDEGTIIEPNAVIKGPCWIGKNCQIRSGCYIRENVIIDDGCIVANSSEFKNSVLFDGCEVPHFNYVGDSILGHKAHLGAGAVLSNLRLDRENVTVRNGEKVVSTGLRKFGAIVGDHAEIGCNSVIGRRHGDADRGGGDAALHRPATEGRGEFGVGSDLLRAGRSDGHGADHRRRRPSRRADDGRSSPCSFGTRHIDATEHQEGLMLAIAAKSLVKLACLVLVRALHHLWTVRRPGKSVGRRRQGAATPSSSTTCRAAALMAQALASTFAILLLPRMFHVTVIENDSDARESGARAGCSRSTSS